MRDFDAELEALKEKMNAVRRDKQTAERRANEKLGKALREMFPDVPDDASKLREYLEDWKGAQSAYPEVSSATDHAESRVQAEQCELGYSRQAGSPEGRQPLSVQETYRR